MTLKKKKKKKKKKNFNRITSKYLLQEWKKVQYHKLFQWRKEQENAFETSIIVSSCFGICKLWSATWGPYWC